MEKFVCKICGEEISLENEHLHYVCLKELADSNNEEVENYDIEEIYEEIKD